MCGSLARHKILTGSRVRDDEGNTLPCHTLSTKISKRKNKSLFKASLMKKGRRNKTKKLAWVDELAESFEFYWVIPGRNGNTADWLPREPFIIYTWRFRVKQWYFFVVTWLLIAICLRRKAFRSAESHLGKEASQKACLGQNEPLAAVFPYILLTLWMNFSRTTTNTNWRRWR